MVDPTDFSSKKKKSLEATPRPPAPPSPNVLTGQWRIGREPHQVGRAYTSGSKSEPVSRLPSPGKRTVYNASYTDSYSPQSERLSRVNIPSSPSRGSRLYHSERLSRVNVPASTPTVPPNIRLSRVNVTSGRFGHHHPYRQSVLDSPPVPELGLPNHIHDLPPSPPHPFPLPPVNPPFADRHGTVSLPPLSPEFETTAPSDLRRCNDSHPHSAGEAVRAKSSIPYLLQNNSAHNGMPSCMSIDNLITRN